MGEQIEQVYCAGKIHQQDWRHLIFPELRTFDAETHWIRDSGISPTKGELSPEPSMPRVGRFVYVGPFFIRGEHGEVEQGREHTSSDLGLSEQHRRELIVRVCRQGIMQCDLMFVWLDDPSAYGTIAEIGFAHAMSRPIAIYEPPHVTDAQSTDMWFAKAMATTVRTADNPVAAWADFTEKFWTPADEKPLPFKLDGYIYVVRAETGAYKIGFTRNLDQRLNLFTVKLPFKTECVHTMETDDMRLSERFFHTKFAAKRIGGEWFALDEADLTYLKEIQQHRARPGTETTWL